MNTLVFRGFAVVLLATLVSAHGLRATADAVPEDDAAQLDRAVHAALKQQVSVSFQKSKLIDVMDYLRDTSEVSIYVDWTALRNIGFEQDYPITLQLTKPTELRHVLTLVLHELTAINELDPVAFEVISGVVHITTERALANMISVTRVYDVNDLVAGLGAAEREEMIENLLDLIRVSVGRQEEWVKYGGDHGSVREHNGKVVMRAQPRHHAGLVKLLEQLREGRRLAVDVTATVLLLPEGTLQKHDIEPDVDGGFVYLNDEQAKLLRGQTQTSPEARLAQLPHFTVPNGKSHAANHRNLFADGTAADLTGAPYHELAMTCAATVGSQRQYATIKITALFRSLLDTTWRDRPVADMALSVPSGSTLLLLGNHVIDQLRLNADQTLDGPFELIVLLRPTITPKP